MHTLTSDTKRFLQERAKSFLTGTGGDRMKAAYMALKARSLTGYPRETIDRFAREIAEAIKA